jgi:hypothetical protein
MGAGKGSIHSGRTPLQRQVLSRFGFGKSSPIVMIGKSRLLRVSITDGRIPQRRVFSGMGPMPTSSRGARLPPRVNPGISPKKLLEIFSFAFYFLGGAGFPCRTLKNQQSQEVTMFLCAKRLYPCIAASLVGLLFCGSSALAQQTFKYSFQAPPGFKNTYKQSHEIEVDDVAGHKIRVAEVNGDYASLGDAAPMYAGVRVKESRVYLSSDYISGNGAASGYEIAMMENGDRIFMKVNILLHTKIGSDGKPVSQFSETHVITGGTGKFKGIRGLLRTSSGITDLKTGVSGSGTEGEYYFID